MAAWFKRFLDERYINLHPIQTLRWHREGSPEHPWCLPPYSSPLDPWMA
jgi:hypothetical protein